MGLLFQKRFHQGLIDGTVSLTFRKWSRAQVKPGGRYRCHPIGVLEVDAIDRVTIGDISDDEARKSGFADRRELVEYLGGPRKSEPVFRVALHHVGDVDAKPEAFAADLSADELDRLTRALAKLDETSERGAWTRATLDLIGKHPHRRAGDLADLLGREKLELKEDVRKLKRLGLTISHEVGYSLSPRGVAYLGKAKRAKGKR